MRNLLTTLRDQDPSLKNVNRLFRAAQEKAEEDGTVVPTRKEVEKFLSPLDTRMALHENVWLIATDL